MENFNVNDPSFQEGSANLVFNKGLTGVVTDVKIKVVKKTVSDKETSPDYKIYVWDKDQIANIDKLTDDKIYPVNKGFYYTSEFKTEKGKQFAVRELRQFLKVAGHPADEKGNFIFGETTFKDYNAFLDYTMLYLKKTIDSDSSLKFDVSVDYGTKDYPKEFLQLNGFPHWICRTGAEKLALSRDSLLERPKKDSKTDDIPFDNKSAATGW